MLRLRRTIMTLTDKKELKRMVEFELRRVKKWR